MKDKRVMKGRIIGGEQFSEKEYEQTLYASIEPLPYKLFKELITKETKIEIKLLE